MFLREELPDSPFEFVCEEVDALQLGAGLGIVVGVDIGTAAGEEADDSFAAEVGC